MNLIGENHWKNELLHIFGKIRVASEMSLLSILLPPCASEVLDQLGNGSSGEQSPVTLVLLHHAWALPSTLQLDRGMFHIPVPQSTDYRATETVRGELLG